MPTDNGKGVLTLTKLGGYQTGSLVVTETELELKSGHLFGSVKKMTAGSTYVVRYAQGSVSIRGSVYDITIVEGLVDGKVKVNAIINMQSGSAVVAFTDDAGQTLSEVVLPLQGLSTGTGAITQISPALLAALEQLLADMGVPPVLTVRILTSDQTTVTFLTHTQ